MCVCVCVCVCVCQPDRKSRKRERERERERERVVPANISPSNSAMLDRALRLSTASAGPRLAADAEPLSIG